MEVLGVYILKANIVISTMFAAYYLLFRKEKLLNYNRFFLLVILLLTIALPITPSSNYFNSLNTPETKVQFKSFADLYSGFGPATFAVTDVIDSTPSVLSPHSEQHLSLYHILFVFYFMGSGVLLIRLSIQLYKLFRIIRESEKCRSGRIIYCRSKRRISAFSFFNFIVVNKEDYSESDYKQIIVHEQLHCRQWHSLDVLVVETIHIFLWVNPLMILFKRCLKLNLEYLADDYVAKSGNDIKSYQMHILRSSLKSAPIRLSNLFNSSKLKQRIWMMNKDKSSKGQLFKYPLLVPMILGLYLFLQSFKAEQTLKHEYESSFNENKDFEGYYQSAKANHVFIKISVLGSQIILKQGWDGKEVTLKKQSGLEFNNEDGSFPLKFIKGKDGTVAEALAFKKDSWKKVKKHQNFIKREMILPPSQLKEMEGYYQLRGKAFYLRITAAANKLTVKEMWSGREHSIFPESDKKFFSKKSDFRLQFIRDIDLKISATLVLDKDVWYKVKHYEPIIKKIVDVPMKILKSYEGKYAAGPRWILTITEEENHLKITPNQDAPITVLPENQHKFFVKGDPTTTVEFIEDENGFIEKVLLMQNGVPVEAKKIE